MYEFLDRSISLAIPRVKDFRGLNPNGFDKAGNYNFGFNEQTVFPEVDSAAVTFPAGHERNDGDNGRKTPIRAAASLLKQFGFPFRVRRRKLELAITHVQNRRLKDKYGNQSLGSKTASA